MSIRNDVLVYPFDLPVVSEINGRPNCVAAGAAIRNMTVCVRFSGDRLSLEQNDLRVVMVPVDVSACLWCSGGTLNELGCTMFRLFGTTQC